MPEAEIRGAHCCSNRRPARFKGWVREYPLRLWHARDNSCGGSLFSNACVMARYLLRMYALTDETVRPVTLLPAGNETVINQLDAFADPISRSTSTGLGESPQVKRDNCRSQIRPATSKS